MIYLKIIVGTVASDIQPIGNGSSLISTQQYYDLNEGLQWLWAGRQA